MAVELTASAEESAARASLIEAGADAAGRRPDVPADFAAQLFARVVPEDVARYAPEDLAQLAERAFDFLAEHHAGRAEDRAARPCRCRRGRARPSPWSNSSTTICRSWSIR